MAMTAGSWSFLALLSSGFCFSWPSTASAAATMSTWRRIHGAGLCSVLLEYSSCAPLGVASLSGSAGSSTADSSSDWVALFFHGLIRFAWSPWCSSWKLLRCVRQSSQVGEEGLVCYREFLAAFLCVVPASSSGQAVPMVVVAGVKRRFFR